MRPRSAHSSGSTRRLRFEQLENRWLLSGAGSDPNIPELISPLTGTTVATPAVTLEFKPLSGYSGPYLVRLDDTSIRDSLLPSGVESAPAWIPNPSERIPRSRRNWRT